MEAPVGFSSRAPAEAFPSLRVRPAVQQYSCGGDWGRFSQRCSPLAWGSFASLSLSLWACARRPRPCNRRSRAAATAAVANEDPVRVVIVPGNGVSESVRSCNWYGWLEAQLLDRGVQHVGLSEMPDPMTASEAEWVPFIIESLAGGVDSLPRTVIVGHSSGAAAAMRIAETHRLAGMVLVSAYKSDLGYPSERLSGYFSRPWLWEAQKANCGWIVQFASDDDPFLPLEAEQRAVRDALSPKVEYYELTGRSHFFDPFSELLAVLDSKLNLGGKAA